MQLQKSMQTYAEARVVIPWLYAKLMQMYGTIHENDGAIILPCFSTMQTMKTHFAAQLILTSAI